MRATAGGRVSAQERHRPLPAAAEITSAEALTGNHDARLVNMRARPLARSPRRLSGIDYDVLTMQEGSTLFEAALLASEKARAFKLGSLLRVTGVCDVRSAASSWTKRSP